jgi:hypothetical protein
VCSNPILHLNTNVQERSMPETKGVSFKNIK